MPTLPPDPALWLLSVAVYGLRALIALALLPPFASRLVPGMARGALALAIVLPVIWRQIVEPAPLDVSALGLLLLALREAAIGRGVGLGLAAFCAGLQAAGEIIDHQTGLTFTQNLDPMNGNSTSITALFIQQIIFTVLMVAGLLLMLADALYLSYQWWPVGKPLPSFAGQVPLTLITQSAGIFTLALLLSGPVVLVLFVIDACAGMLNKAAPQLNVFNLTLSLKSVIGLGVLALALPAIVERSVVLLQTVAQQVRALITAGG
jgi:type III secretion protein T